MTVSTTVSERVGRSLVAAMGEAGWDLALFPPGVFDRIAAGDITLGELFAIADRLGMQPEQFVA